MATRAKFIVQSKTESMLTVDRGHGWKAEKVVTIKMQPVMNGSEENKKFYQYTPGGEINLTVLPESVGDQFEIGAEFYVDFSRAST